jgi:pectin methylesterase-like acyl-CoA thioesterase
MSPQFLHRTAFAPGLLAAVAAAAACASRSTPQPHLPEPAAPQPVPPAPLHEHSIQADIDALPATGGVVTIAPGTYRERLLITKPHVTLRGGSVDARRTVIVAGESAGTIGSGFKSATVEVRGRDFNAQDLTFMNDYNRTHVQQFKGSQALALLVAGDRAVFRNVRLVGDQDTLYAGSSDCTPPGHDPRACTPTRQYFEDCYIEGNVDFIYGNSIAVFERCEIRSNPHVIGYITANGRQDPGEQSVFVFDRCKLTAYPGVEHVWLGRPWRPLASVVFLRTEMGAHVEPGGWREWHPGETTYMDTVFYAEYGSTGPGAHPTERDPHTRKLTADDVAAWEPKRVLGVGDGWDPITAN